MGETKLHSVSNSKILGGIAGILAIPIIYLILPINVELLPRITLALTAWLIIWLIARPIDSGYTGLIYIVLQLLLQFPPPAVFTWFTISPGWFQMASFVIAAVMVRSGLARRMAYTLMYKLRANTISRFMYASVIVILLMILLIPSPTALIAIMIPLMVYVAEAWDLPSRNETIKGVPALALPTFFLIILCGVAGTWIRTGFSLNLVTMALSGINIEWIDWFVHAAPIVWVFSFLSVFLLIAVFRPSKSIVAHQDALKVKYDELGPISITEKLVLFIMFVILVLWITEPYHKISTGWIALAGVCIFALPQLKLFRSFDEVIATINWPIMFFITALFAMVNAMNSTGASQIIAGYISVLKPATETGYYILSSLVGTFLTSILGTNFVQGVIIPIFTGWAAEIGIPASKAMLAIWIPTVLGGNLLPTLLPSVLFAWTFKYKGEKLFTFGDGFKVTLITFGAYYIVALLIQLTIWRFI